MSQGSTSTVHVTPLGTSKPAVASRTRDWRVASDGRGAGAEDADGRIAASGVAEAVAELGGGLANGRLLGAADDDADH
jgi:hypothetical protein